MTSTPFSTAGPFIVTALVTEEGNLALLMSDDRVIVAGRVIGPPGEKGDRGMPGVRGPAGRDGNTVLTTDGPPQPDDGKEGDWAIDKRGLKLYGPKTAAGWGKGNPMTLTDAALDAAIKRFNSRGGPGGGRFFGMGAPSAGIATPSEPGLKPILGNAKPFPAALATDIAAEKDILSIHALIYAAGATGGSYMEVVVSRYGASTEWTVNWELFMGSNPPAITFDSSVNARDELVLAATSNQPLVEIRGRLALI
jgi:hypothetical protein